MLACNDLLFSRIATDTADIYRNPEPVSGVTGDPVIHLQGVAVVPLMPMLQTPFQRCVLNKHPR